VIDALRRRKVRRETLASELISGETSAEPLIETLAAAAEGPETAYERAEAGWEIRRLVDQLNPNQREALLLQYVEELSIAEIAVVMGRSAMAVNSLLQRARATLLRLGRSYFLGEAGGEL
jgi:RNA polymerase sigma factor (sigma-70 family)